MYTVYLIPYTDCGFFFFFPFLFFLGFLVLVFLSVLSLYMYETYVFIFQVSNAIVFFVNIINKLGEKKRNYHSGKNC